MKKIFPGYYLPSDSEFSKLWNSCLFVFDANVLLNLYRYSQKTRDELLNILTKLSSRIWIPHQVALEYQKNRLNVINQQLDVYNQIDSIIEKTKRDIALKISTNRYHSSLDVKKITESFDNSINIFTVELSKSRDLHPDFIKKDSVRIALDKIFNDKIGPPFTKERLREIYTEGLERYANNIPPGYKDIKDKPGLEKYGDLVLWFQVILKAKESNKPVVFVTDEKKEDWWVKASGQTIGPLPEMINEFYLESNQMFYLYKIDYFIQQANKFLNERADPNAIKEIRDIRKYDETRNSTILEIVKQYQLVNPWQNAIGSSEILKQAQEQYEKNKYLFAGSLSGVVKEAQEQYEKNKYLYESSFSGVVKEAQEQYEKNKYLYDSSLLGVITEAQKSIAAKEWSELNQPQVEPTESFDSHGDNISTEKGNFVDDNAVNEIDTIGDGDIGINESKSTDGDKEVKL